MRTAYVWTFLLILLLIPAQSARAQPQVLTAQQKAADLEFLRTAIKERHAHPFHAANQATFDRAVDQAVAKVGGLDDLGFAIEVAKIAALLEDGHTGAFLANDRQRPLPRLPVELLKVSDGWIVSAADAAHKQLLGAEVLALDGRPPAELMTAVAPLVARDNDQGIAKGAASLMAVPQILHALGAARSPERVTARLRLADGRIEERVVAATLKPELSDAGSPLSDRGIFKARGGKFSHAYLPASRAFLISFNSADFPEAEFVPLLDAMVADARTHAVDKVILDLRWNRGGSIRNTSGLFSAVAQLVPLWKPGNLLVLVGPENYSAGTLHASTFERLSNALFVGEPTSGRPAFSGELRRMRLPHSQIEVRYSAAIRAPMEPYDLRPALFPHVTVPLRVEHVRSGRDPVLEAALALDQYKPVGPRLAALAVAGEQAALRAFTERAGAGLEPGYYLNEESLAAAGTDFYAQKKFDLARMMFLLEAELYPFSATAQYYLGETSRALGDMDAARRHFRKAFEMDKRYVQLFELDSLAP